MITHSGNELIEVLERNLPPLFIESIYIFPIFRRTKTSKKDSVFGTTEPCEHDAT